jgi:hypothetical protein
VGKEERLSPCLTRKTRGVPASLSGILIYARNPLKMIYKYSFGVPPAEIDRLQIFFFEVTLVFL